MRIEIAGPIGAGKTSLAKLLIELGCGVVFEEFKLNPFWKAFYSNPGKYNFETELTFLLQHYHEVRRKIEESSLIACDFSFVQDLAYAEMGLAEKEFTIFKDTYTHVVSELAPPDILIYLDCEPLELLKRINHRGRKEEILINSSFLEGLRSQLRNNIEFINTQPNKTKVIVFDTNKINFINSSSDRLMVLNKIRELI